MGLRLAGSLELPSGCGGIGRRTGLRNRRSKGREGSTPSIRTSSRSQPKGDPDARAARRGGVSRRASSGAVRASVTATRPGPRRSQERQITEGAGRWACLSRSGQRARWFLNLPGFHGGAYVVAYVRTRASVVFSATMAATTPSAPSARTTSSRGCSSSWPTATIGSRSSSTSTRLTIGRENSLHKLDTLLAALRVFREGLVEEFEPYDRRQREFEALRR
jgi:hypothetical protein